MVNCWLLANVGLLPGGPHTIDLVVVRVKANVVEVRVVKTVEMKVKDRPGEPTHVVGVSHGGLNGSHYHTLKVEFRPSPPTRRHLFEKICSELWELVHTLIDHSHLFACSVNEGLHMICAKPDY